MGTVLEEQYSTFDEQKQALEDCLKDLPSASSQLMRWRYYDRLKLPDIAACIKKTYTATNTILCRIRAALLACIETKMTELAQ